MEKRGTEGKGFDLGLMLENSFLGCENYSPNKLTPSGYKSKNKDVYYCKNFRRIVDPDSSSVSLRNPLFREIPCTTCCERKEGGRYVNKI